MTEYRIGRLWCEACDEPVPAVAVVWTPGTIFTCPQCQAAIQG